ncbi:MAG: hypothetical protein CVT70_17170 [Alphaproteobacteria bacterium HGW-Alphaproteobacteria-1]|jgi:hypothetical protein|nr:MAG: hypothetical protein CVT70_17170 [Alphaproteobacteria bacterium HGW-Alphaproteobacteria-1]
MAQELTDYEVAVAENADLAKINDRFRSTWGADFTIPGQIVMTRGVANLPYEAQVKITVAVMQFADFTEDNDPYGDHSFGLFTTEGERLFWKIDYYDSAYRYGSENPRDLARTRRVLTILLASEY